MTNRLKLAWRGMGGEGFFRPIYYAPQIISLLVAGVRLTEGQEPQWPTLIGYFFANALGLLICLVFATLVLLFKKKCRLYFSPWVVVTLATLIGVLKAVSTAAILVLLGLEADFAESTVSRLTGAIIASNAVVVLTSMIWAMLATYSAEREKLLLSRVSREQPRITRAVFEELEGLLVELRTHSKTSPAPEVSRTLIGSLLEEKIKPLSKEIWNRESKKLRSFDIFSLLRQTVFHDPYPALLTALVIPVFSLAWEAVLDGSWPDVLKILLQVLLVWSALSILNLLKNKISDRAMLAVATVMLFLTSISAGFFVPLFLGTETITTAALTALFFLTFLPNVTLLFGFGQSFIRASKNQSQTRQEEIAALDSSATFQLEEILIARELAAALHGKVQNRFVLSMARIKSGEATLEDELSEIESTIEQLKKSIFDNRSVETREIVDAFSQFLEVEISAPKNELTKLQARLVEEAISNSYRHGKATKVIVKFDAAERLLSVDDDGFGPKEGPKGLGSYIFDSIGPWSIKALEAGGTRFSLRFDS